ncbi:hypothetical protein RGQ29_024623 [Quercus rubra]|uniref:Small ribosomal subunit protein eS4 C-terminal domain-containing protein n=1 Tax=Quercus rubra TaxID=3512 RepID=A0AAN7EVK0_QUERU|nr:hypothetical protein RGQ29_024623 [Quercus rubra]
MVTGGRNRGRVGDIMNREKRKRTFETVHTQDAMGHEFATRLGNVFTIGKGTKPWVSLPKGKGIKLTIIEEARNRLGAQTGENKILDKMHWQKVAEVEKLTQTVRELEDAVLTGAAAANAVRDYQRKVQEMNEKRKTLEREVARAKVTANRVATVVANEWKDANDKVMPVKQWLEERKFFQACIVKTKYSFTYIFREMQQLCDKLAVAEHTTKAEAQLKVLEERLKTSNGNSRIASEGRTISNGSSRRQSLGGAANFSKSSSNGYLSKRTSNSHYGLLRSNSASTLLKHNNISTRPFDGGSRSLDRDKLIPDASGKDNVPTNTCDQNLISKTNGTHMESANGTPIGNTKPEHEDYVSGMLKACNERDQTFKDKDDAIEVDTLNKAMEVEAKKIKEHDQSMWHISTPRGAVNGSHLTSAR